MKDNDKEDILSDFEVDSEERGTSSHQSDHQVYIYLHIYDMSLKTLCSACLPLKLTNLMLVLETLPLLASYDGLENVSVIIFIPLLHFYYRGYSYFRFACMLVLVWQAREWTAYLQSSQGHALQSESKV